MKFDEHSFYTLHMFTLSYLNLPQGRNCKVPLRGSSLALVLLVVPQTSKIIPEICGPKMTVTMQKFLGRVLFLVHCLAHSVKLPYIASYIRT